MTSGKRTVADLAACFDLARDRSGPALDDGMVARLSDLRDEAEGEGHWLLAYLIDVAAVEAERIVERGKMPE